MSSSSKTGNLWNFLVERHTRAKEESLRAFLFSSKMLQAAFYTFQKFLKCILRFKTLRHFLQMLFLHWILKDTSIPVVSTETLRTEDFISTRILIFCNFYWEHDTSFHV